MISFGLVNIPIKVYTAVREKEISFHYIHKEDGGRVSFAKICKECGQTLSQDDLVRGYEYSKGKHVTLTDEDFDKVNIESTKTLVIEDFVDPASVDPNFFDKPYYLVPDAKGDIPYVLLRDALKRMDRVGIGKVTVRNKEQLAMIRPAGDALIMDTLHFADEIVSAEGLGIPTEKVTVGQRELDMAELLVKSMEGDFEPEKYHDTYREALEQVIDAKLEGQEVTSEGPSREATTNVIDIMAKLKASIEATESSKAPARKPKARKSA